MSDNSKKMDTEQEAVVIRENSEDSYWLKTYDVSAEELKKAGNNISISAKIIKAAFKKKQPSLS